MQCKKRKPSGGGRRAANLIATPIARAIDRPLEAPILASPSIPFLLSSQKPKIPRAPLPLLLLDPLSSTLLSLDPLSSIARIDSSTRKIAPPSPIPPRISAKAQRVVVVG